MNCKHCHHVAHGEQRCLECDCNPYSGQIGPSKWNETHRGVQERRAYRRAAVRLFPDAVVDPHVTPHITNDNAGAFITVTLWVPRAEMEKDL